MVVRGLRWVGVSFSGDSCEGLVSGRSCWATGPRAAGLREWEKSEKQRQ